MESGRITTHLWPASRFLAAFSAADRAAPLLPPEVKYLYVRTLQEYTCIKIYFYID